MHARQRPSGQEWDVYSDAGKWLAGPFDCEDDARCWIQEHGE